MKFICRKRASFYWLMTLIVLLSAVMVSCGGHVRECVNVHPYSSTQAGLLTLRGHVSDSHFSTQDVSHYNDAVYQEIMWDPVTDTVTGAENLRGPKLLLTLTNDSKTDFMIPRHTDAYPDWTTQPAGAIIQLVGGGVEHLNPQVPEGIHIRPSDCSGAFVKFMQGDSLLVSDTIDIFYLFRTESPRAGRYWLRAGFRNYRWYDTIPPVWIGEIWSDTLRFEIVEAP